MVDAIRQDLFELNSEVPLSVGYVVLRKEQWDVENSFLEQVLVTSSRQSHELTDLGRFHQIVNDDLHAAIDDGDIGFINGRGDLRVILSTRANHNTLLVTEQCDNLCMFCSQPPKERDDQWLYLQAALALAAFQSDDPIGISGGEPLLNKELFLSFLDTVHEFSPQTPLHILTNGRAFSDVEFTQEVSRKCNELSLTFGIPLYSGLSSEHDLLVGKSGAYLETFSGLINAGNSGIPIELRFIPTQKNLSQLEATVELVARCFSSILQISIMNLEPTGWAKRNWNLLASPPQSYLESLEKAIQVAERACLPIYLFNYPLCHLNENLRSFAIKSISDWKNYFPDECNDCSARAACTGYFSSSKGLLHQQARKIQ